MSQRKIEEEISNIENIFQSGIYLSKSQYAKLENRLAKLKESSTGKIFKYKDEHFPVIDIKSQTVKPIIEYCPQINQIAPPKIEGSFVDWNCFEKIYHDYAYCRIKIYYFSLKRKIHLLDCLKNAKGDYDIYRQYFRYDYLVEEEKRMGKIIDEHTFWSKLHLFFRGLKKGANTSSGAESIINHIKTQLDKYEIGDMLKNLLDSLQGLKRFPKKIENFDFTIIEEIQSILDNLVKENDPHISCEYYVKFLDNGLEKIGINSFFYAEYDHFEQCVFHPVNCEVNYLMNLSLKEIETFINEKNYFPNNNFIFIYHPPFGRGILKFYFEQYPNFELRGVPSTVKILRSYRTLRRRENQGEYKNHQSEYKNHQKGWQLSYPNNPSYNYLSESDYELLPVELKDQYPYQHTKRNLFVIDYLYYRLLEEDGGEMIHQHSLDSFRNLAYNYSMIK